jgi:hypothetical protein
LCCVAAASVAVAYGGSVRGLAAQGAGRAQAGSGEGVWVAWAVGGVILVAVAAWVLAASCCGSSSHPDQGRLARKGSVSRSSMKRKFGDQHAAVLERRTSERNLGGAMASLSVESPLRAAGAAAGAAGAAGGAGAEKKELPRAASKAALKGAKEEEKEKERGKEKEKEKVKEEEKEKAPPGPPKVPKRTVPGPPPRGGAAEKREEAPENGEGGRKVGEKVEKAEVRANPLAALDAPSAESAKSTKSAIITDLKAKVVERVTDGEDTWYVDLDSGDTAWDVPKDALVLTTPEEVAAARRERERVRRSQGASLARREETEGAGTATNAAAAAVAGAPAPRTFRAETDGEDTWYVDVATGDSVWDLPPDAVLVNADPKAKASTKAAAPKFRKETDGEDTWYVNVDTGDTSWDLPSGAELVD